RRIALQARQKKSAAAQFRIVRLRDQPLIDGERFGGSAFKSGALSKVRAEKSAVGVKSFRPFKMRIGERGIARIEIGAGGRRFRPAGKLIGALGLGEGGGARKSGGGEVRRPDRRINVSQRRGDVKTVRILRPRRQ